MNIHETSGDSLTVGLPETRRRLIALRRKHGATSPIGYRCSNILEQLQVPELPKALLARQMADLQRFLSC